ncbi:EAL domain-containing protein [Ningiella sp. W23]|uniref:sensor domain-containing protein n=1 Tax=Ningiella sp. W23 TaxID=3023715 RepID=UPI0037583AA1
MLNRRSASDVRGAINTAQELLFDPEAKTQVFSQMLEHFLSLTKSDLCACFVANETVSEAITEECDKLHGIYLDSVKSFVNKDVLFTWVRTKNALSRPSFYQAPYPFACAALMNEETHTQAIMIIPIRIHDELMAIYVLAKKSGTYDAAILTKLRPVIGAISCTMQSAESVDSNFSGIDKTIANDNYMSSLIASSPLAIIVVDHTDKVVVANPNSLLTFADKNNRDPDILNGRDIHDLLPNYEDLFKWSRQQARFGEMNHAKGPQLFKDQKAFTIKGQALSVGLTIFRYNKGPLRYTTLQIEDTTSFIEQTEHHKSTAQQFEALTQLVPVGIIRVNIYWECEFANDKWLEYSGIELEDDGDQNWINAVHPEDIEGFLKAIKQSLEHASDYEQQVRIVNALGATKWTDFHSRVLVDDDGNVEGFLGTFSDVTERHIIQEKLKQVAQFDTLTGLANRLLLQDRLNQAFANAQRNHQIVSVLFLDLDEFKHINDTLGHDVGDILLQQVANRLTNVLRANDTIARFGGDEFVILLGEDDHFTEILVVAEKIIAHVAEPYLIGGEQLFVTVSVGIAQGNFEDSNPETLLKHADLALYSAKNEGKNNYQIFNEEFAQNTHERVEILNQLRADSSLSRYQLFYQPICDAKDKRVLGFEALIRFQANDGTLVAPDHFIPILEESGMILQVGRWVIQEACRQLAIWQKSGDFVPQGYVSVNVSAKQLLHADFVEELRQCFDIFRVAPQCMVMELTETVLIKKPEQIGNVLAEVKALGVKLALDDFGTGYSSLSYLQNYPFDMLKIDKSFIDDLSEDSKDTKITKAIIALASSMELTVAAEGVETQVAYDAIERMGADIFQGFYVSKPLSSVSATALMAGSTADEEAIEAQNEQIEVPK